MSRQGVLRVVAGVLVAVAVCGDAPANGADLGDIHVVITNLRNGNGEVLISLYNRAEGFPKDRSAVIRSAAVPADAAGQVMTVFENLPHGDYAIAVLHDEDFSKEKYFLGANLNFGIFNMDLEGDRTGETTSYSLKFGWRF